MRIGDIVGWHVFGTLSVRTVRILAWLPWTQRMKVRVLKVDGQDSSLQYIAYAGRSRLRAIPEEA